MKEKFGGEDSMRGVESPAFSQVSVIMKQSILLDSIKS